MSIVIFLTVRISRVLRSPTSKFHNSSECLLMEIKACNCVRLMPRQHTQICALIQTDWSKPAASNIAWSSTVTKRYAFGLLWAWSRSRFLNQVYLGVNWIAIGSFLNSFQWSILTNFAKIHKICYSEVTQSTGFFTFQETLSYVRKLFQSSSRIRTNFHPWPTIDVWE